MKAVTFLALLSVTGLATIIYVGGFFDGGEIAQIDKTVEKADAIEKTLPPTLPKTEKETPVADRNQEVHESPPKLGNIRTTKVNDDVLNLKKHIPLFPREESRAAKGEVVKMIADRPLEELAPLLGMPPDGKIIYPYVRTAAMRGRLDLLQYMLQHTPITEQRKFDDLLKYSSFSGNIEVVRYLLSFGATEKIYAEKTPELFKSGLVQRSIRHARNLEFTEALIEMGFSIDKSSVEHMKQQKGLKPESRKIIEALEQKGLI